MGWLLRKTERGAKQFLIRVAVRDAPFSLLELAQNGAWRETVPDPDRGVRRTFALLSQVWGAAYLDEAKATGGVLTWPATNCLAAL